MGRDTKAERQMKGFTDRMTDREAWVKIRSTPWEPGYWEERLFGLGWWATIPTWFRMGSRLMCQTLHTAYQVGPAKAYIYIVRSDEEGLARASSLIHQNPILMKKGFIGRRYNPDILTRLMKMMNKYE